MNVRPALMAHILPMGNYIQAFLTKYSPKTRLFFSNPHIFFSTRILYFKNVTTTRQKRRSQFWFILCPDSHILRLVNFLHPFPLCKSGRGPSLGTKSTGSLILVFSETTTKKSKCLLFSATWCVVYCSPG